MSEGAGPAAHAAGVLAQPIERAATRGGVAVLVAVSVYSYRSLSISILSIKTRQLGSVLALPCCLLKAASPRLAQTFVTPRSCGNERLAERSRLVVVDAP